MNDGDHVRIFDTTLRDGEQSPGISLNRQEKVEIAHQLARLGVDVIEAGFPIASPGDFEAVQAIARQVQGPTICGLARCNDADIDRAWEALKESPKPRIHVFLATSAIHREFKLHMAKDEIVRRAEAGSPIASPGDFGAGQASARQVQGPTICGLARCNDADIDRAWEALKESPKPRIHVFLATSAIHREFKLHMAKDEIVRRAVAGVQRAKAVCDDVEFSPEDAARTELDFLAEVVER